MVDVDVYVTSTKKFYPGMHSYRRGDAVLALQCAILRLKLKKTDHEDHDSAIVVSSGLSFGHGHVCV